MVKKGCRKQKSLLSRSLEDLFLALDVLGDPAGARTQDPNIKSVVLYQLSYWIILLLFDENE